LVVVITAGGVGNELTVDDWVADVVGAWVEVLAGFRITAQTGAATASICQCADIVVIARFGVVGENTALGRLASVIGAGVEINTSGRSVSVLASFAWLAGVQCALVAVVAVGRG